MANNYITGNAITNATSYDLYEKKSGVYTKLSTENNIGFYLPSLGMASGNHTLAVKATAPNYPDSNYSNEVTYSTSKNIDSVAHGTLTYRDIFITNNIAPAINHNSLKSANGNYEYKINDSNTNNKDPKISTDTVSKNNYVPQHSIHVYQDGSANYLTTATVPAGNYFVAFNINIEQYTAGALGISFIDAALNKEAVTSGYEVMSNVLTTTTAKSVYIGAMNSAKLRGYINNPVVVNMNIFGSDVPSGEQLATLYNNFNGMLND